MAELRAWVLARLLWDPSRDGEALTNEFIEGYYGPAASHIKAYLKVTHDAVEASGDWLRLLRARHRQVPLVRQRCREAGSASKRRGGRSGQSELRFRVQVASFHHVHRQRAMERNARGRQGSQRRLAHAQSAKDTYDQFLAIARKKNVTRLNEWQDGFDALDKAVERAKN